MVPRTSIPLHFFVLSLMVGLTVTVFNDPYIQRRHRNVMLGIIGLCLSLIVQNYAEDLLALGEARVLARTLVAIYGYIARPLVITLFSFIISHKERQTFPILLTAINALVHLTALFTPVVFWIRKDNHYQAGPLGSFCLYISMVLLAYLLYLTIREYSRAPKKEIVLPVLIILLILLATWMDGQVGSARQPITYLTVAMIVSCVFYYIWLHVQFVREHEEDLKARQRIRIMMSQIQPHFLYNTLSTIQVLCQLDPERAADVTGQFSAYLRQNLAALNQQGLIPFWKELEHTRTYVSIEETRFENIHVEYDIQDSEFSLPPLTLQPLVENAIRYGVRIRDRGIVRITTRRTPDAHEIVVWDNGTGFDVAKLAQLDSSHIGIRNVRERLESMCGGSMAIESRIDEGSTFTIRIPIRDQGGEGKP